MATFRHHAWIDAPSDEVWKVVSDAGGVSEWFTMIEESSFDGRVRTCSIGGGMTIEEEVVTSDDTMRRFQYSIVGGPMVPEHHLATIDVIDHGDGCLVVYGVDVRPDDAAAMLDPAIADAIVALKAHCEG